jgi:hypothetical protein
MEINAYTRLASFVNLRKKYGKDFYAKVVYDKTEYLMKIIETNYDERNFKGWVSMYKLNNKLLLNEIRTSKALFNDIGNNYEKCWIFMTLTASQIGNDFYIAQDDELDETFDEEYGKTFLQKSRSLHKDLPNISDEDKIFKKVFGDRLIHYGNGGISSLIVPLFLEEILPFEYEKRKRLVELLSVLSEQRKDILVSPVIDIIDPDLSPNYNFRFDPESFFEYRLLNKKYKVNLDLDEETIKIFSLRSQYAWFPTKIKVLKSGRKANLYGPFRHLRLKGNSELYKYIMEIFLHMVPGFKKLQLIKENEDTTLQVVLKCQMSEIQPGETQSGSWLIEGKTENIIAVGVYYPLMDFTDKNLELLFTHLRGPSKEYAQRDKINSTYNLKIQEGTALVYGTSLPHKLLPFTNTEDYALRRCVITFYIIDPLKPLEDTCKTWERRRIASLIDSLNGLCKPGKNTIKEFLIEKSSEDSMSLNQMKERKKVIKEALMRDNLRWGLIQHQTYGEVEYFDLFHPTESSILNKYNQVYEDLN